MSAPGVVEVVAGGDVIVNRSEPETVFEQCRDTLRSADIAFANSETTYSIRGTKAANIVGMMRADPRNLSALSYAGFDVMSFANNHHLDAGPEAFFDTLDGLRNHGILTCGAGADIAEARRPAIIERNGAKVAFLGYSSILWPCGTQPDHHRPVAHRCMYRRDTNKSSWSNRARHRGSVPNHPRRISMLCVQMSVLPARSVMSLRCLCTGASTSALSSSLNTSQSLPKQQSMLVPTSSSGTTSTS